MRENIRLIQQLEKDKERRKERNYEFKFLIKLIFRDKKKKKVICVVGGGDLIRGGWNTVSLLKNIGLGIFGGSSHLALLNGKCQW